VPGNPLLPGVVRPEWVQLVGCNQAGSEGLVGWEYTTSQSAIFATDASSAFPLFGITAPEPPGFDNWKKSRTTRVGPGRPGPPGDPNCRPMPVGGACLDSNAPTSQWFDRVGLWIWCWDNKLGVPIVEISMRCGFDTQGEEIFRGSFQIGQNAMIEFATISGLPMSHVQFWARTTLENESANFAMKVFLDRSGSPFQLRWGPSVTKIIPAAANTLPP